MCWRSLPGGGFLVSGHHQFSGAATFLYPDCRTALAGEFLRGEMVAARRAEVVGAANCCSYFCPLMVPVLSPAEGPALGLDPATRLSFCSEPLLRDPYEEIFVEVGPSKIPGAGEGLLATSAIQAGTVVAFYNGLSIQAEDGDDRAPDDYRILLDSATDLDIPAPLTSTARYCATLGHKVCHSFKPNSEFDTFYHPRFGLIRCVATVRDVAQGEEITVHYRYPLALAPDWYRVAWARHQKRVRGLPSWSRVLAGGDQSKTIGLV